LWVPIFKRKGTILSGRKLSRPMIQNFRARPKRETYSSHSKRNLNLDFHFLRGKNCEINPDFVHLCSCCASHSRSCKLGDLRSFFDLRCSHSRFGSSNLTLAPTAYSLAYADHALHLFSFAHVHYLVLKPCSFVLSGLACAVVLPHPCSRCSTRQPAWPNEYK
jgi:hypothetical protein